MSDPFKKLWKCPFSIVIDSNEQTPWLFKNMQVNNKAALVDIVRKPMFTMHKRVVIDSERGGHDVGLADYSIDGLEERIQIERKSLSDLFGTISGRFRKFEAQICRMHEDCDYSAVIVEGSVTAVRNWTGPGRKPASIEGTIRAWKQRYPACHWFLLPSRAEAEIKAFEIMCRFWTDYQEKKLPSMR